jgi:murein DD-endopeptidase MepM/ murein hydrolase activator NlpD
LEQLGIWKHGCDQPRQRLVTPAHLNAYYVSCGQFIYQGNPIGAIGTTGNTTGSHLHFEMMYNAVRVNPQTPP